MMNRQDKRIKRARARHDLARLVMGTILLVLYMYVCMNSVDIIYLLCMIKVRVRYCTCSLWRML